MKHIVRFTGSALLALILSHTLAHAAFHDGMTEGKVAFKSMGPLAFGPEGILFIADTKAAAVVAIATGDNKSSIAWASPAALRRLTMRAAPLRE